LAYNITYQNTRSSKIEGGCNRIHLLILEVKVIWIRTKAFVLVQAVNLLYFFRS
jgi:hypothetical protein